MPIIHRCREGALPQRNIAPRNFRLTFLVGGVVAQLAHHRGGAVEQRPEVLAVVEGHAQPGVRVDALDRLRQLAENEMGVEVANTTGEADLQ